MLLRKYRAGDDFARTKGEKIDLRPGKILGIGANYRAHAAEMGRELPAEPLIFLKPSSAIIATGQPIVRPSGYERVDFEGEVGVVIGRPARRVAPADVLAYVLGFVCVNDVTCRDLQRKDSQWARAKGFDSFCPVGPRIVAGLDPSDIGLTTRVNGEVRQQSSTSDMIFPIHFLISHLSQVMTLAIGDIITTGTPAGVGNLEVGDRVEVEVQGVGVLENHVVSDE